MSEGGTPDVTPDRASDGRAGIATLDQVMDEINDV
jgi:hypothetical protein